MKFRSTPAKQTFLALDNMNVEEIERIIQNPLCSQLYGLKIGMEQFYKYQGKVLDLIEEAKNHPESKIAELKVFLDLKLHDIPNTVYKAISSLQKHSFDYITIHLSGGRKMCEAAIEARNKYLPTLKILGVSYLTSLTQEDFESVWDLQSKEQVQQAMSRLYRIAYGNGEEQQIDGIVMSALDVELFNQVKKDYSTRKKEIICITPGIRFEDEIKAGKTQDQARICTPQEALEKGSDLLVMGRSLTKFFQAQQSHSNPDFWES